MALLHHYKERVQAFKCGPDFIDPQFHQKITKTPSINLDGYMMTQEQLRWIFHHYFQSEVAIIEGVMGYYDGMDKKASAYDVAKALDVGSLIVLDASGSYITIAAVLKGLKDFRSDSTIKAVVLNRCSSAMHYNLIKKHIEAECDGIKVCGWIKKDLDALKSRYLGLDLRELEREDLFVVASEVLEHIDLALLESVMEYQSSYKSTTYPFPTIQKSDKKCVLVRDNNFSFVYHDNLVYLTECFREVSVIDSTKDEVVPKDADLVILPGGYVESDEAYNKIKASKKFLNSLKEHAKTKKIYAECAGMIYLGLRCDEKAMSGILPLEFTLGKKRERLGYYKCDLFGKTIKGHAFHYTRITNAPKTEIKLYKSDKKSAKDGGYKTENIFATYLHTMWRVGSLIDYHILL